MNFLIQSRRFLEHDTGQHVENPGRLQAIHSRLTQLQGWKSLIPRLATPQEIELVHRPQVSQQLLELAARGGGFLDSDTYLCPASVEIAQLAVGAGLHLLEEVCSQSQPSQGFALLRPPGHHATPSQSMGFCLYSNIAIAARYAQQVLGLERIVVLDWDVHHGNGTQDCLEPTNIPFISLHQWPLYPGSGWYDERGQGNLYNLPLPAGCGDLDYAWALHQLVRPVLEQYQPQLLLISAGYDAHALDPLGSMKLSTQGFAQLASWLALWCPQAHRVAFLEGGYHPQALAESVQATLAAWERPIPAACPLAEQVNPQVRQRIREAQSFWLGH